MFSMGSIRSAAILFLLLQQVSRTVTASAAAETNRDNPVRIINGTVATHENTLHQVSIRRRSSDSFFFGTGHICGGSLITPTAVVSAAHCFVDYNSEARDYMSAHNFIVVLGILNRFERDNNTLLHNINHIVYAREHFNLSSYQDDIALLFLDGTVPEPHLTAQPIAISGARVAAGTVCQVSGWGLTQFGTGSDQLMIVDVPMLSMEACSDETIFPPGTMRDGMVCAGYLEGERDACAGDSGGPLVCNGLLAGIVSFGFGCAKAHLPGVYTEVAYFQRWIMAAIEERRAGGTAP